MNKIHSKKKRADFINLFLENKILQGTILFFISIIIYSNTFYHEYVYDDIIVIQQNSIVQKGISGIPELLTLDSFYGYDKGQSELTGGRYRPLSLITFAIEKEFWNDNATPAHILNVFLYALCCVLLFITLQCLLPAFSPIIIFLASLLFTLHPVHTEVVANVKSRDELLCLLFILLVFFLWMRLLKTKTVLNLILAILAFVLALLSKETAILLIIWMPIAWWMNKETSIKKILISIIPFLIISIGYLFIRSAISGTIGDKVAADIMNNPFLLATQNEKYATIFWILFIYLMKSIYPVILSYDYTYNAIPYQNFNQPQVWFSIIILACIVGFFISSVVKKNQNALLVSLWLFPILLVSNLFFNVGASMADRFLFVPSIAICVFIVSFLFYISKFVFSDSTKNQIFIIFVLIISTVYSYKTYSRNFNWKSNKSIFAADALQVPQSVKTTLNFGSILMTEADATSDIKVKKEKLDSAFHYFNTGIKVFATADLLNHMGAYFSLINAIDSSEFYYRKSLAVKPDFVMGKNNLLSLLQKKGAKLHASQKFDSAFIVFKKQLELEPDYSDAYNSIGTIYFAKQKFDSAEFYFNKTLSLQPTHQLAASNLANTYLNEGNYFFQKNNYDAALEYYIKAIKFKPDYVEAYANAGVIEMQKKNYTDAKKYFETALQYNPQHEFSRTRLKECENLLMK